MESKIGASVQAIRLEDGEANYMGDGRWLLERFEEIDGLDQRHTFAITEEDRQALLALAATGGALTIAVEDGKAHNMGSGCFVLVRSEEQDGEYVHHAIGVTVDDLEGLVA